MAGLLACILAAPAFAAEKELPTFTLPEDAPDYRGAMQAYNKGKFAQALPQFKRLATLGHAGAEFMLGVMYFYGRGVDREYSLASIWFFKSARQGNPAAQLAFGSMFIRGVGVSRDRVEAYKWLSLAAESDIERIAGQARTLREKAAESMTAEAIETAREAAAAFEAVRTGPLGLE